MGCTLRWGIACLLLMSVGCSGRTQPSESEFEELLVACLNDDTAACRTIESDIKQRRSLLTAATKSQDRLARYGAYYYLAKSFPEALTGGEVEQAIRSETDDAVRILLIEIAVEKDLTSIVPVLDELWNGDHPTAILRMSAVAIRYLDPSAEKYLNATLSQFPVAERERRKEMIRYALQAPKPTLEHL